MTVCFLPTLNSQMSLPLTKLAEKTPSITLIFLHGLGDVADGWFQTFSAQKNGKMLKLICPQAKVQPVTLNGGMPTNSWFDVYGLAPSSPQDEKGVKESSDYLLSLVRKEIDTGTPPSKIVIGGFSQGGAVALYTLLTNEKLDIGGLVALSSFLPCHEKLIEKYGSLKRSSYPPIFQTHTQHDPVVPCAYGELTGKVIKEKFNFTNYQFIKSNDFGHTVSEGQMSKLMNWLMEIGGK
ncbi:hypothetical protein SNEBB_008095 [Seison nebaliae]|nr:hypothetical protein SNEBB_008095 [Seison nebaliae]